jgi:hypothetical protein
MLVLVVHHLEMLVRQYSAPIGITLGDGPALHLDRGHREFQGYSPMITAYPFKNCVAIHSSLVLLSSWCTR